MQSGARFYQSGTIAPNQTVVRMPELENALRDGISSDNVQQLQKHAGASFLLLQSRSESCTIFSRLFEVCSQAPWRSANWLLEG
jgi:hypothetical protein